MSEVEVRMTMVGPAGRSLKFLNNKNNLANLYLHKQLVQFEKERSFNMSHFEQERLEATEFLRNIKKTDTDSPEVKQFIRQGCNWTDEVVPPNPQSPKRQKKSKKRLTLTAPAVLEQSGQQLNPHPDTEPVEICHNVQPEAENINREKSLYLQLAVKGRNSNEEPVKTSAPKFPKPNPRTLLDVMMGLNAFSHVPPPRCKSSEDVRSESRQSAESRLSLARDSPDVNADNIAASFMKHWKKTVATRKQSIVEKLTEEQSRSESRAAHDHRPLSTLESVPEDSDCCNTGSQRVKRRSLAMRQNNQIPSLPVIVQEDHRKETFIAWVKEKKEETKGSSLPAFANPARIDKAKQRRRSFLKWLDNRAKVNPDDSEPKETVKDLSSSKRQPVYEDINEDNETKDIGDMMQTAFQIKKRFRDPVDRSVHNGYGSLDHIKA